MISVKIAINDEKIIGSVSALTVEELNDFTIIEIPYPDVIFSDFVNREFKEDVYALRKKDVNKLACKQSIISKIREKYSLDDEMAIVRQRISKPVEYAEYESYCEQAKAEAKIKYKE